MANKENDIKDISSSEGNKPSDNKKKDFQADSFEYIPSDQIGSKEQETKQNDYTSSSIKNDSSDVQSEKSENSDTNVIDNTIDQTISENNQPSNEENTVDSDNGIDFKMAEPRDSYQLLVIDDDKWIRKIFKQNILGWGFEFLEADNSVDGLRLAIEKNPLAIFLDVVLPDIYGDITLKFIKGLESSKKPPVVIISGNLNKNLLRQTYLDGAEGFILKPFTKEVLKEKLLSVIDRSILARMRHDDVLNDF